MNILLVTDLYPADGGHSRREVSYALHDIVRQWVLTENVLVLRPFVLPDWRHKNYRSRTGTITLDGVSLVHAPAWKFPLLPRFWLSGLYHRLRTSGFSPQIVVAHLGFNLLFADRLARRLRIPLVAAVHLGDLRCGPTMLGEETLQGIYQRAAGIACRSPAIMRRFSQEYPELRDKCFVAYSGIDPSWFSSGGPSAARFSGWPRARPLVFCTLASLLKCKNIDTNLRALARLPKAIDWRYHIIGDGPEKGPLQALATSLGIAERVEFLGFLSPQEAKRELLSCHVFLMISRDTFGLAFLEAMACGLVVVGSRGYGIDGIIEHGRNGYLCAPEDAGELNLLLERIVTEVDPDTVHALLARARETVAQYTLERAAQNYLENIASVLGREGTTGPDQHPADRMRRVPRPS